MKKLIKNETNITIWSSTIEESNGKRKRVKDERIYTGAKFIDFGIINLGINGSEQGVIYSYINDEDVDCISIAPLDLVEIL